MSDPRGLNYLVVRYDLRATRGVIEERFERREDALAYCQALRQVALVPDTYFNGVQAIFRIYQLVEDELGILRGAAAGAASRDGDGAPEPAGGAPGGGPDHSRSESGAVP